MNQGDRSLDFVGSPTNQGPVPLIPCKYYFVDNGLLTLQLLGAETILLENMVALSLFRKYGHDQDNERVFFYNVNVKVDFYVPEDELAIQVSYSIADPETEKREKEPLEKLPNVHPCRRRIIITYDEEGTLTDKHGTIEVIPCWKWLLECQIGYRKYARYAGR